MLKFSVIQRLSKRLHVTISGHLFDDAEAAYVETTLMQNPAIEKAQFLRVHVTLLSTIQGMK